MIRTVFVGSLLGALSACGGMSFGNNDPGADTFLEGGTVTEDVVTGESFTTGSIAVDPDRPTAWTLHQSFDDDGVAVRKRLMAATVDGRVDEVLSMVGRHDARLMFPSTGVLMMSQDDSGGERLDLFDPVTYDLLASAAADTRYHGTRTSPSGRFVAVADNEAPQHPIHIIDTRTLEQVVVPHGGEYIEAMWLNQRDVLVVAILGSWAWDDDDDDSSLRVLAWSFEDGQTLDRPVVDGIWADPVLDTAIDDAVYDIGLSTTWIGISPDDATAVIPIHNPAEERRELAVVDLGTPSLRRIPEAMGPVAFSPDSSTIIGFAPGTRVTIDEEGEESEMPTFLVQLYDRQTLAMTDALDAGMIPQYTITPGDHMLVIAPSFIDEGPLVLHDLETGETTEIHTPEPIHLTEFTARPSTSELWLVDDGLHRLDLLTATVESVDPGWPMEHINRTADDRYLVMDDERSPSLVFWDPDRRRMHRRVSLR